MNEDKIAKELEVYEKLAAQDKNIDVASLMIQALEKHQSNMLPMNQKRWAYLVSLGAPPFGLIFAAKFWVSGKDDSKQAAWMCIGLTAVSLLVFVFLAKVIFSSSGASVDQIKEIKPTDIKQLYE